MGLAALTGKLGRKLAILLAINVVFTALVAVVAFVLGWTAYARALPELSGWHTQFPRSEFGAENERSGFTLDDYLRQEEAVFAELADLERAWAPEIEGRYSRFKPESICHPDRASDRNWNRTMVLESDAPVGGALLVHGLSDSPYSFRSLAIALHERGWTVVNLRVPGHGTCPGALAEVDHEDWSAAVRVAARSVRERIPESAPLVLFGFSNGGALSVQYAVDAIGRDDLPRADRIVLFSPMIGISPLAEATELYSFVGRVSGLDRVAWSRIEREVDPYKYSSWPMNANVQAWQMTQRVEADLKRLAGEGRLDAFPSVLAFQSAVDSTVDPTKLIERLFARLPARADTPNELVLFDTNRVNTLNELVSKSFELKLEPLLQRDNPPFRLTVITNANEDTRDVVERTWADDAAHDAALGLVWPETVFSLSHGAVPIPPDDPILGLQPRAGWAGPRLGQLSLRGESGVLDISEAMMFRLRSNPFYTYVERRTLDWLIAD